MKLTAAGTVADLHGIPSWRITPLTFEKFKTVFSVGKGKHNLNNSQKIIPKKIELILKKGHFTYF